MPGPIQTRHASDTVDELIGSAYPIVKKVAQNIAHVKRVSEHMSEIDGVFEHVQHIYGIYNNIDTIAALAVSINGIIDITNHFDEIMEIYTSLPDILNAAANVAAAVSLAQAWATNDFGIPVQTGAYSAKHWAITSQNSADSSTSAATTANGHAVAASSSATAAQVYRDASQAARDLSIAAKTASETAATNSANSATASDTARAASVVAKDASVAAKTAAETAQTGAQTAKTASETARDASVTAKVLSESARDTAITNAGTATTQAGIATTQAGISTTKAGEAVASATTASGHATTATTKAGIATTQAGISTTKAGEAATSAAAALADKNLAVTARTASETARDLSIAAKDASVAAKVLAETAAINAVNAFDAFDDRYLGAKTNDPTLDNDGAALLDGAFYWNTTLKAPRFYDLGTTTWATFSGGGDDGGTAETTIFTNTTSGLTAVNVQTAIDELDGIVDGIKVKTDWITVTQSADLDNKLDKTGGTLTGPLAFTHQASPANPTAGTLALFAKSDNKLYTLTPDGTEMAVGSDDPISTFYESYAEGGVDYKLPVNPPNNNALMVVVGGVVQAKTGAYTWGGTRLTLNEDPGEEVVEVLILAEPPVATAVNGVPSGGLNGQALVKTSSDNYDAEWQDITPALLGTTGDVDNAILRADGTEGGTLKSSPVTLSDDGVLSGMSDGLFSGRVQVGAGYTWATLPTPLAGAIIGVTDATPLEKGLAISDGSVWRPLGPLRSAAIIITDGMTSLEWTDVPPNINRVTVMFKSVVVSGSNDLLVNIGDASGYTTNNFSTSIKTDGSSGSNTTSTSGQIIRLSGSLGVHGHMTLTRQQHTGGTDMWIVTHMLRVDTDKATFGGGNSYMGGVMTKLKVVLNGSNTFTSGVVALLFE